MKDCSKSQERRGWGVAYLGGEAVIAVGGANLATCRRGGAISAGAEGATASAMHIAMQQLLPPVL